MHNNLYVHNKKLFYSWKFQDNQEKSIEVEMNSRATRMLVAVAVVIPCLFAFVEDATGAPRGKGSSSGSGRDGSSGVRSGSGGSGGGRGGGSLSPWEIVLIGLGAIALTIFAWCCDKYC